MIAKVTRMNEFRRMMRSVLKNNWQEQWISVALVSLSAGLLLSRALVSVASVAMVVPCFFGTAYLRVKKNMVIAAGLLLLPVLLSGLWSSDMGSWWKSLTVKIPLLTMMAGLTVTNISRRRWIQLTWIYVLMMVAGCAWSLQQYMIHHSVIEAGYLRAKVLPTPSDDDYVRFSWMVATAIMAGINCIAMQVDRKANILLSALLVFLTLYLHLLAARTGLLCLYSGGLLYLLYLFFVSGKYRAGLWLLSGMAALVLFAFLCLQTFRNRVQYIIFDHSTFGNGHFTPGYNDGARWLSVRAGYGIMQLHPFTGVGFGDIRAAVEQWHLINQPDSFAYERFMPANEWLVYGAGSGWPGALCFTAGLLLLLYTTTTRTITGILLAACALLPFITDDSMEGQYGVVLLAFIVFFAQRNYPIQKA